MIAMSVVPLRRLYDVEQILEVHRLLGQAERKFVIGHDDAGRVLAADARVVLGKAIGKGSFGPPTRAASGPRNALAASGSLGASGSGDGGQTPSGGSGGGGQLRICDAGQASGGGGGDASSAAWPFGDGPVSTGGLISWATTAAAAPAGEPASKKRPRKGSASK